MTCVPYYRLQPHIRYLSSLFWEVIREFTFHSFYKDNPLITLTSVLKKQGAAFKGLLIYLSNSGGEKIKKSSKTSLLDCKIHESTHYKWFFPKLKLQLIFSQNIRRVLYTIRRAVIGLFIYSSNSWGEKIKKSSKTSSLDWKILETIYYKWFFSKLKLQWIYFQNIRRVLYTIRQAVKYRIVGLFKLFREWEN